MVRIETQNMRSFALPQDDLIGFDAQHTGTGEALADLQTAAVDDGNPPLR